ncbi:MAG: PIN domain-containing protein [Terriglobales bacterium]
MKFFFDTSVLVAAILRQHVHHRTSLAAYLKTEKKIAGCAAHTLAEVYSALTRMPGAQRISGEQASFFIDEFRRRLTIVTLDEADYASTIASAAAQGVTGGTIYDALLAKCALKANAAIIYTWDLGHFRLFGAEVSSRVRTP